MQIHFFLYSQLYPWEVINVWVVLKSKQNVINYSLIFFHAFLFIIIIFIVIPLFVPFQISRALTIALGIIMKSRCFL